MIVVTALPAVIEAEWTEPGSASPAPAQADSARDLIALWVARSASPHTDGTEGGRHGRHRNARAG